jgi:hypothetical protein
MKYRPWLLALCCLAILAVSLDMCTRRPDPVKEPTRQEVIDLRFSDWDGSHIGLAKHLKANYPYEHVSTAYFDRGTDSLIVKTRFMSGTADLTAVALVDVNTGMLIKMINIFPTNQ